jgi:3',5'-cyclic AMP phosphodiesterase CpdA
MDKKILLSVVSFFIFLNPLPSEAFSLGIVADIHAGGQKDVVESGQIVLYPSRYCDNLEGIRESGVDYILTLGDNTLNGKSSEAKKVISCMQDYDNVIWTKGNHDKEEAWKYFNSPNYYSKNIGNWKIIVLDSTKLFPTGSGGFLDGQLDWLKKELDETEKADDENIFIAMHHNIFKRYLLFPDIAPSDIAFPQFFKPVSAELTQPIYGKFKKMIEANKQVKYIYSGHLHTSNRCLRINGVEYCSVPSISTVGYEGYFAKLFLD